MFDSERKLVRVLVCDEIQSMTVQLNSGMVTCETIHCVRDEILVEYNVSYVYICNNAMLSVLSRSRLGVTADHSTQ